MCYISANKFCSIDKYEKPCLSYPEIVMIKAMLFFHQTVTVKKPKIENNWFAQQTSIKKKKSHLLRTVKKNALICVLSSLALSKEEVDSSVRVSNGEKG